MLRGTCHCGAISWTLADYPESVTSCNCTLCHRYGALWAYSFEGDGIAFFGLTATYQSAKKDNPALEIVFCPVCAGVLAWRSLQVEKDGRRRAAVNVRLAPINDVAHVQVIHFDGLRTFEDFPLSRRKPGEL